MDTYTTKYKLEMSFLFRTKIISKFLFYFCTNNLFTNNNKNDTNSCSKEIKIKKKGRKFHFKSHLFDHIFDHIRGII